jgi:hypothetical protein
MNIKQFFVGRAFGTIILLSIVVIILGFFAFNNYIYNEKQGEQINTEIKLGTGVPYFAWRFEQANTLNLDGNPNTDIFLDLTYENGVIQNKLIDTVPGGCNELPDNQSDSMDNTKDIQCYSAGLGQRYKITQGVSSYQVQRKTFEEGLPDYTPPAYEYEVVAEFPL